MALSWVSTPLECAEASTSLFWHVGWPPDHLPDPPLSLGWPPGHPPDPLLSLGGLLGRPPELLPCAEQNRTCSSVLDGLPATLLTFGPALNGLPINHLNFGQPMDGPLTIQTFFQFLVCMFCDSQASSCRFLFFHICVPPLCPRSSHCPPLPLEFWGEGFGTSGDAPLRRG